MFQDFLFINRLSLRKKMEYLFYCWRPGCGSQLEELFHIIKNGFFDPSVYKVNNFMCY
jgi:hypothetical protein